MGHVNWPRPLEGDDKLPPNGRGQFTWPTEVAYTYTKFDDSSFSRNREEGWFVIRRLRLTKINYLPDEF